MFVINKENNKIEAIQSKSFSELGFREREHLQEWLEDNPIAFDEELLIIQKEFDGFDDTRERLDLLALDKQGDIVVIENKLDDSGRNVTWQVLKYASYCSSLSKNQIKAIFQSYLSKNKKDELAENLMCEFLEIDDLEEATLNKNQRIILVAANFRKEVTSTVLWLLTKYNLQIQCLKVTPYSFNEQYLLNIEQIIPVKEAQEFTIRMAEKSLEDQNAQSEVKLRHKLRLEFWKNLLEKYNKESELFSNISPSKNSWIKTGIGYSGLSLTFVASKKYARVELYLSRGIRTENKFIFDKILKYKNEIESITGILEWERLDHRDACRIKKERQGLNIFEKSDWSEMIDFMTESMSEFEKAFLTPMKTIIQECKNEFK